MKNLLKKITSIFSVLAVAVLASLLLGSGKLSAQSLVYGQSSGTDVPSFNNFTGVPGYIGDEHDFVRAKVDGEINNAYRNSVDSTCTNGSKFKVLLYVHNTAKDTLNNNGTGTGVSRNTTAKVVIPSGEQTSFNLSGSIMSSNASGVSDGAVINCGGKKFKISYVQNSATAFLNHTGTTVPVSDSLVTTNPYAVGAPIGSLAMDGNVWGCFGDRVWLTFLVEVVEVQPPVVSATCDILTAPLYKVKENDSVEFSASASAQNASITGYNFFVNGTQTQTGASNKFTFKQAKAGTYTVSVSANVSNGTVAAANANCTKQVEVSTTPVDPTPVCGPLTVVSVNRNTRSVLADYAPKNDSRVVLKKAVYNFNNKADNSDVIERTGADLIKAVTYVFDKEGTYNLVVTLTISVNGVDRSVTSADCNKSITINPTEVTPVCGPVTVTVVDRNTRKVKVVYTPSNDSRVVLKKVTYNFNDKSDNSDVIEMTNTNEVTYVYEKDGTYKLVISMVIAVDNKDMDVTGADCTLDIAVAPMEELCSVNGVTYAIAKTDPRCKVCPTKSTMLVDDTRCKVCPTNSSMNYDDPNCRVLGVTTSTPSKPTILPETGASSLAAMFAVVVIAGAVAHNVYTKKQTA